MITARETAELLAKRAEDVARHLLPDGKRHGNEWHASNVLGGSGDSLKVCIKGTKAGVWSDFATGEAGDLLNLWALNRQITLLKAISEACLYLGIPDNKITSPRPLNFVRPKYMPIVKIDHESPLMEYLSATRCLTDKTIAKFMVSESNGTIMFPYFVGNALLSAKYLKIDRTQGKKKMYTEKNCEPCLFGWQALDPLARTVVLCEGEIDAMSLHDYGFNALSIPFGAGSGGKQGWIEYEYDRLSVFDEIFICMDMDEPGQKEANALIERLGRHRCKLVELPYNDANECLVNGVTSGAMAAIFANAKSFDPTELKDAKMSAAKVHERINPTADTFTGYTAPWAKTHENIRFRPYELNVWTGINGHGKSQLIGHVLLDMLAQGAKVCLASLEMRPEIFISRLVRQCSAMDTPSTSYIDEIMTWLSGKLWYIDVLGKIDLTRILDIFSYAMHKYGIDVFIIDSFMMLSGIYDEDYKSQNMAIEQLCIFKNQNYCQLHLIAHPRKGADENALPGKMDVKGSGTITDAADNCFSLWRNKKKETLKEKSLRNEILSDKELKSLTMGDAFWGCDKQRNGNWEGRVMLWYDPKSFQFVERDKCKPKRYVDYSSLKE